MQQIIGEFRFGYVLLPLQSSAATITYGANNTPDTNPNTACAPTCPELTTAAGRGVFSLVSTTTIEAVTFWTVESQGAYLGGLFNWRILADVNNAPGALFGSGQFSLTPHNSTGTVQVAGLTLDGFRNDFARVITSIGPTMRTSPRFAAWAQGLIFTVPVAMARNFP